MSNDDRRSRLLWWLFGAIAGVAATATVLLYWLIRRGHLAVDQAAPPPPPPDSGSSCNCSNSISGVCDDIVDSVCEQPMNEVCGNVNACTDTANGCTNSVNDCSGSVNSCHGPTCNASDSCGNVLSTNTSHLAVLTQAWFSAPLWRLLTGSPIRLTGPLTARSRTTIPARAGIAVILGYQRLLSRRLGTRCRFTPTCSEYGIDALRAYGALDGALLTIARIRRCTTAVPHGTPDPIGRTHRMLRLT